MSKKFSLFRTTAVFCFKLMVLNLAYAENSEVNIADMPIRVSKDPTKPAISYPMLEGMPGKPISSPVADLEMIAYTDKGEPFAIINGARFEKGDLFEGAIIKKIEPYRIIFDQEEKAPLELEYAALNIKESGGK